MRKVSKEEALRRLEKVLETMPDPQRGESDDPESTEWLRNVETMLVYTFGEESTQLAEFKKVDFHRMVSLDEVVHRDEDPDALYDITHARGMSDVGSLLRSMVDEVREYWQEGEVGGTMRNNQRDARISVFLVHGRDSGAKDEVARFVEGLELEPIILVEMPSGGKTIIEKIEEHSDVDYAIVLLTPDDTGALRGEELSPRPRQNAIFELGFFVGLLGRKRVCVLTKGDPETPSNYAGVECFPMEGGSWKLQLIAELQKAGFDVDANKATRARR